MGKKILGDSTVAVLLIALTTFVAGFGSHLLYQRWSTRPELEEGSELSRRADTVHEAPVTPGTHSVSYVPPSRPVDKPAELPLIQAREVEKIRERAGSAARVRGRIFRVGHSEKSNTYFLNFGPSREALTAVVFASAAELFEKNKIALRSFDGREVEVSGDIKNHPQYGLELIIESPAQLKIVN
jgi:hypothetical protein